MYSARAIGQYFFWQWHFFGAIQGRLTIKNLAATICLQSCATQSHIVTTFFVVLPDMFFRVNGDLFQNSQKHDGLRQFVIEYALNLLFFDKNTKHRTKL